MPELPEVETVRKSLLRLIKGKQIKDIVVLYEKTIANISSSLFADSLKKEKIETIDRYGKWLIIRFSNYILLSHLRMEGKYFLKNESDPLMKHDLIIFNFFDNTSLRYNDVRKFGKMYLFKKGDILEPLEKLGLDPWSLSLTPLYLKEKGKNKKIAIKEALLDQRIIVGIGNIYADEILFKAKVNPFKEFKNVNEEEFKRIIKYTREVLDDAIKMGGTTIKSFESSEGVTGRFQQKLLVHTKKGENCPLCGSMILVKKLGGRSTYYCPKCQKVA